MTREGAQQPGDETRSGGCGAKVKKVKKVEKVEKVEKFIACREQVPWSCYLVAFYLGYTRNVFNVACSVPKCDFRTENAPK